MAVYLIIDNMGFFGSSEKELKCKKKKYNINKNDNERRLDGILMMTRSIGDADVKNITSKPYIKSLKVSDYKYIILLYYIFNKWRV